jgi:hypothetical protein
MTLMATPSFIFYLLGGKLDDQAVAGIDMLGLTTIGNLGGWG